MSAAAVRKRGQRRVTRRRARSNDEPSGEEGKSKQISHQRLGVDTPSQAFEAQLFQGPLRPGVPVGTGIRQPENQCKTTESSRGPRLKAGHDARRSSPVRPIIAGRAANAWKQQDREMHPPAVLFPASGPVRGCLNAAIELGKEAAHPPLVGMGLLHHSHS